MRIAIVTHSVVRGDGQGRVGYEIAKEALLRGHKVTLLADRVGEELQNLGARWVPVHPRFQRPMLWKIKGFTAAADHCLDRMRKEFDVVQGFGFVLTRPHEVSGAQFVHSAWSKSPDHIARGRYDAWARYQWLYSGCNAQWERIAFSQAKRVVACSQRVRCELMEAGVPEKRIQVILNAVDIDEFHPGYADRATLGLPTDVPLAVFVGDIRTNRKNLDAVLHGLTFCPGVHLAVVGKTDSSPFPALAEKLGLQDRVHFLGFRKDVADIMRASDLYVFPSTYEPFGIVVLEALATGTPVITASTVGAAELVSEECGIVLSDPNDARALGDALGSLMYDGERRKRMSVVARTVAENHTWKQMAAAYLTLYEEVAA